MFTCGPAFLTGGGSQPDFPPLDVYTGSSGAYSVRKLRTAYAGNCIRVRRTSDNTLTDIGFDVNGMLDTAALTTFLSGSDGYVHTWYDQSGSGRDAVNAAATGQPRIALAGVVETLNGLPSLLFINTGLDIFLQFTGYAMRSAFAVGYASSGGLKTVVGGTGNGGPDFRFRGLGSGNAVAEINRASGSIVVTSATFPADRAVQVSFNAPSTGSSVYVNGAYGATAAGDPAFSAALTVYIGSSRLGQEFLGHMSELILYTGDQSGIRSGMQSNQMSKYSIT